MSCDRYRNALTDAAAGEPSTPELEAHLAGCDGCRSELDGLRRLMAAADDELSALATAEPSPALRARIREVVTEAAPAPTWRWSLAWPLAVVAVVAVAAFGVWRTAAGRSPVGPVVAESTPSPSAAKAGPPSVLPRPVTRMESRPTAPAAAAASVSLGSGHGAEPEVLVPAGGQEALLRYVALVHREGLDAPVLTAVGQPSPNLAEPRPIEVRPLEIAPLDPAEDSET